MLGKLLGLTGPYRPAPWRPMDTVAVGNYLAREFGGGGGSELQNLQFLEYLDDRADQGRGQAARSPTRPRSSTTPAGPTTSPRPTTVPGRRWPARAGPAARRPAPDAAVLHAAARPCRR